MLLALAALTIQPTASAVRTSSCELHLFALDLGTGSQPAGNLLVQVAPPSADPLAFVNIQSPRDRLDEVSDADYRRLLNLAPDARIVRHWDVQPGRSVRKMTTPMTPTPGRCHLELIGYSSSGMMANRSSVGKDEVFVNLVLREFAADSSVRFQLDKGGYGAVETVKKVGREGALASLRQASLSIVQNFGERVAKQRLKAR